MATTFRLLAGAGLAASLIALAGAPASAQFFLPPPPPPLPPGEAADILRHDLGFRRVGQPAFTGRFYFIDALDRTGAQVRVIMNARTGRILQVEELAPAPRVAQPRMHEAPRQRTAALPAPEAPRRAGARDDNQVAPTRQAARPAAPDPRAVPPANRPAVTTPPVTVAPMTVSPETGRPSLRTAPILNIERGPSVTDPQTVRIPDQTENAPPFARGAPAAAIAEPAAAPPASAAPVVPTLVAPVQAAPSPALPAAQQAAPASQSAVPSATPGSGSVAQRTGAPVRDVTREPMAPPLTDGMRPAPLEGVPGGSSASGLPQVRPAPLQ